MHTQQAFASILEGVPQWDKMPYVLTLKSMTSDAMPTTCWEKYTILGSRQVSPENTMASRKESESHMAWNIY